MPKNNSHAQILRLFFIMKASGVTGGGRGDSAPRDF